MKKIFTAFLFVGFYSAGLILLQAFILLQTSAALAQVHPDLEWKIRKLPHFDLIYDAKHQDLADLYAIRLENSVTLLSKVFTEIPSRTVVTLLDRTDQPNGSATAFPYDWITVYPILPSPWETISDYGDWSQELVNHEYTHILSFAPRRGVVKALYYGFGNIITPNLLLPRWWLEGIAVEMETRTSQHGRLRSPNQDATLRAFEIDNRWSEFNVATINETSIPTFPQGARPYLFGSLIWSQAMKDNQTEKINDLHWRYAGRFPFLLESPAAEILGKPYDYLFEDTLQDLRQRTQLQLEQIRKANASVFKPLLNKKVETYSASLSPDGLKLAFLYKDETLKRSVKILKRKSITENFNEQSLKNVDSGKEEETKDLNPRAPRGENEYLLENTDAPPGGSILRISWFPDSQKFLYDKTDAIDRFTEASDLFVFDIKKSKTERLSTYLRSREPVVSNDGKLVAFIKVHAGKTSLSVFDLETKMETSLYDPGLEYRISHPSFITNDEVIFSERIFGIEKLKSYNLKTHQMKEFLPQFTDAKLPTFTKLGLFFISSRSGVPNVYLSKSPYANAVAITNSLTAVLDYELDPYSKDLYVTSIEGSGSKILILSEKNWHLKELPKISGLLADRYPQTAQPSSSLVAGAASRTSNLSTTTAINVAESNYKIEKNSADEDVDYSSLSYLYPRYWIPNIYTHSEGTTLSLITSGNDPLLKHLYSLQPVYDTGSKEFSYAVSYTNNSFYPTLSAAATDSHLLLPISSQEYRQQYYLLNANFESRPLGIKWNSSFLEEASLDIGWNWISRSFISSRSYQTGPRLGLNYLDVSMSGEQISPEGGSMMDFAVTSFLSGDNERRSFNQFNASYQKYFNQFFWKLPKRHAWMLRWKGQFIDERVLEPELTPSQNFALFANSKNPFIVVRGYPTGNFTIKSYSQYALEYRFPITYIYRGAGTTPLFLRRLHGNILAEGMHMDGYVTTDAGTNTVARTDRWKFYRTVGVEAKTDVTLAYHFPLSLVVANYWALDYQDSVNSMFYIGLQSN